MLSELIILPTFLTFLSNVEFEILDEIKIRYPEMRQDTIRQENYDTIRFEAQDSIRFEAQDSIRQDVYI